MFIIEMPKQENDLGELISKLPEDTYKWVEPKNFDGAEIVQAVVRMAEITLPLVFAYLMSSKKKHTIVIKRKGKVDVEITAELHKLNPNSDMIMKCLKRMLDEIEEGDENTADSK